MLLSGPSPTGCIGYRKQPGTCAIEASPLKEQTISTRESDQRDDGMQSGRPEPGMGPNVAHGARVAQPELDDCRIVTPLQSLRKDPFDCLPIQKGPYIPEAIDYFFSLFASPYVYRPELVNVKQPGEFQRQYFRFAMQHEVLFQSVMALSLACLQAIRETQALVPTKEVLFHHTNALKGLRQKLSCPSGYADDSTLLSILTLLGVAVRPINATSPSWLTGSAFLLQYRYLRCTPSWPSQSAGRARWSRGVALVSFHPVADIDVSP